MTTPAPGILDAPQELTTVTFVNLVGMVVAFQANFLYEVYALVQIGGNGATSKGRWVPPAGASMQWADKSSLAGSTIHGNNLSAFFDETGECEFAGGGSLADPSFYELTGLIQTASAGNLQLQARLATAPGSETALLGYVRVTPIGPLP